MSAQVAADLRAAADVLERDGWCQRAFKTQDGRRCASQAISVAVDGQDDVDDDDDEYADDGARRWSDALIAVQGLIGSGLHWWNDVPGRTADEVTSALRAAADAAEATS